MSRATRRRRYRTRRAVFDFLVAYIGGRATLERPLTLPGTWVLRNTDKTPKQKARAMMDAGCRWMRPGDVSALLDRRWRP